MAPGDIELSGRPAGQAGFVTQGQVDWIAFGNTVFSASLLVMQRLAGAGIQPTTHCGGLALASQFRLGELGLRRIEAALANLPSVPLFDSIVYVGFGVQSFVKSLAESQSGVNLAALCGCLAASHSEPMAARILASLWDRRGFPITYKPSHAQFLRLVKNCSGICHTTTFSPTIDVMLGGRASRQRQINQDHSAPIYASAAEEIAAALDGLFEVSTGKIEQINVVGGPSCAFIAALSYWLFNLRTYVLEKDDDLIFTSHDDHEPSQVIVRYVDATSHDDLRLASKTYVLGPNEDVVHADDTESRMLRLTVRTPWKGCLERAYGPILLKCLNRHRQLGTFLGSVSRVYAALAKAEPEVGGFSRKYFFGYTPDAYGQGFIQGIERLLPDLLNMTRLKETMMNTSQVTVKQAIEAVEVSIFDLKRACECSVCQGTNVKDFLQIRNCIPAMATTIRQIVSILSGVVNEYGIEPTVFGLEEIHMHEQYLWFEALQAFNSQRQEDMIASVLGLKNVEGEISMLAYEEVSPAVFTKDVETLFLGSRPVDEEVDRASNRLAFSKLGVCIYMNVLQGISCKPEMMRQIHIIPGYISHLDRRYEQILDSGSKENPNQQYLDHTILEAASYDLSRSDVTSTDTSSIEQVRMRAMVTEVMEGDSLRFFYRATVPSGVVDIKPGRFTEQLLLSAGQLYCKHQHGTKSPSQLDLQLNCAFIKSGWNLSEEAIRSLHHTFGLSCCVWGFSNDNYARCLAFEYQSRQAHARPLHNTQGEYFRGQHFPKVRPTRHVRIYLRQQQCLHCCTSIIVNTMGGLNDSLRSGDEVLVHVM